MVARKNKKAATKAEKRAVEFQQMMARGENPYLVFRKRDEDARRAMILKELAAGQVGGCSFSIIAHRRG